LLTQSNYSVPHFVSIANMAMKSASVFLSARDSNGRSSQTFGQRWLIQGLVAFVLKVCIIAFSAFSSTSVPLLPVSSSSRFLLFSMYHSSYSPPCCNAYLLLSFSSLSFFFFFFFFFFFPSFPFIFFFFIFFFLLFSFYFPSLFSLVPFFKVPNALTLFKTFGLWG
jgi:hypothetical protein